jgi:RNA polymerase sigma-70 factor (ECF subfamily)
MSGNTPEAITELLVRWGKGDEEALSSLTPLVFQGLKKQASYLLRGERREHTLQPTALVNEAYLKLVGSGKQPWQNRTHFFAVASRVMRHILVDYARGHRRAKRGGGILKLPLDEAIVVAPETSEEILELDRALELLAKHDVRKARVVELRFFGGLSVDETAEVLQISANTVLRDWNMAKAWLRREINGAESGTAGAVEEG